MKCRLCQKDFSRLIKSHIIPDFLYKDLYDEKHFLAFVELASLKRKKLLPSGFYDTQILCSRCDNEIIGRLETYANTVLFYNEGNFDRNLKATKLKDPSGNSYLQIRNIDYNKFKLFLLSILWKSSITNHPIFNYVQLGKHEERIREMLFNNDSKSETDYPVGIFILTKNDDSLIRLLPNPRKIQNDDEVGYVFLINGIVINYSIEGTRNLQLYDFISIKENGSMNVPIMNQVQTKFYIDSFLGKKLRLHR